LAIVFAIGVVLYFGNEQSKDKHTGESASEFIGDTGNTDTSPKQFAGYDCTVDCSGHEAGYTWAEEHDITDGDDCDTAGEHSNSPSFAEGCHAYVDGESDPEQAADPDDEN
jgi:hypothetical protein